VKIICLLFIPIACLAGATGAGRAAEQAPLAFGAVFAGRVYAVKDDAQVLQIDWRGEEPKDGRLVFFPTALGGDFPPRWKTSSGWLVMTHVDADSAGRGMRVRDINTESEPLAGQLSDNPFCKAGIGTTPSGLSSPPSRMRIRTRRTCLAGRRTRRPSRFTSSRPKSSRPSSSMRTQSNRRSTRPS